MKVLSELKIVRCTECGRYTNPKDVFAGRCFTCRTEKCAKWQHSLTVALLSFVALGATGGLLLCLLN